MARTNSKSVAVIARRGNDLYFPNEFGKLYNFRFYRNVEVERFDYGEVKVRFPSWGIAQRAVNQLRAGKPALWNSYAR